jgi:hypothetical protein
MRIFWGLLLVLSVAWIVVGSIFTSEHFENGDLGEELAAEIRAFGNARDIDAPADLPLPIVFIATGLPFAVIALLFLRRSNKQIAASTALDPDTAIRRQALLVSVLALLFALFLWNTPHINARAAPQAGVEIITSSLALILWPIRLFVTFVHEAGHSLAALLTGGQIQGFTVSPDGSGLAVTAGGYRALVIPAGYLGAALFGSLLFFLTNRMPKWTRGLSVLLGLSIIVLTLIYARPDQSGNLTAQFIGIGFGAAMVALGWLAPRIINVFILNTLAILTGLNAVLDLSILVNNSDAGLGELMNDAAAFSREVTPLLPASLIAFIWSGIALIMLGAAVYFGLVKQVGGEISDAVKGKN